MAGATGFNGKFETETLPIFDFRRDLLRSRPLLEMRATLAELILILQIW